LGEATKTVGFAQDGRKAYEFEIRWGVATDTDDREGRIIAESAVRPTPESLAKALPRFVGTISQTPPIYSAIKVDGERAYAMARRQEEVVLAAREIVVYSFDLIEFLSSESARFRVRCGKGTYVRALARDLAQALGTLGHVGALRRMEVGSFHEKHAIGLDKLEGVGHIPAASAYLLPIRTVLDDIPALALTAEEAQRFRHGQAVALFPVAQRNPNIAIAQGMTVQALFADALVAIAEVGPGMLRSVRVFATS
jgi:tRNA pseudouridine55 synthase